MDSIDAQELDFEHQRGVWREEPAPPTIREVVQQLINHQERLTKLGRVATPLCRHVFWRQVCPVVWRQAEFDESSLTELS
jgi:hypothetical protein